MMHISVVFSKNAHQRIKKRGVLCALHWFTLCHFNSKIPNSGNCQENKAGNVCVLLYVAYALW